MIPRYFHSSVAKNQLVGVRVRDTDAAIPGSILRRLILRYAQNDRSRLVQKPNTINRMASYGRSPGFAARGARARVGVAVASLRFTTCLGAGVRVGVSTRREE